MLVVVGGLKGGTGKSTIAAHLGIEAARAGRDVMLVDADMDQRTLSRYMAVRGQTIARREKLAKEAGVKPRALPVVSVTGVSGTGAGKTIQALANAVEDVVVDCAGFNSSELIQALTICEEWIIPIGTAQLQVWTLPELKTLLDRVNLRRGGATLSGWLLGSRLPTAGGTNHRDLLKELAAHYEGFAAMRTLVHERSAFEKVAREGLSVTEIEKPNVSEAKARDAIRSLFDEAVPATVRKAAHG
jgi:chromosome partitioning protein